METNALLDVRSDITLLYNGITTKLQLQGEYGKLNINSAFPCCNNVNLEL